MPFVIILAPWLFLNCFVFSEKPCLFLENPDYTVPSQWFKNIWTVPLMSTQPLFPLFSLENNFLLNFTVHFIGMSQ